MQSHGNLVARWLGVPAGIEQEIAQTVQIIMEQNGIILNVLTANT